MGAVAVRWGQLPALTLVALILGLVPMARAEQPAQAVVLPPAQARAWLTRINEAANKGTYRGTMVFSADGVVSSSRVAHLCVGDEFIERVEALDGRQHRVYRHNQTVHTVWPQERLVVVEQRSTAAGLVSTRRAVEPRALAHYAVHLQGRHRVAGRMAQVLLLVPGDDLRFAQRLWADEETGLLLRTDVLGPHARVLESAAFGEIEIGARLTAALLLDGMKPAGFRLLPSPNSAVELVSEGWSLRSAPAGFELMGCLKRPASDPARGSLLQAVFSDGLTFVSLFIEPYDERRHAQALMAEMGATRTMMLRDGDHWVTAMGDVPRRTLELLVRALERQR